MRHSKTDPCSKLAAELLGVGPEADATDPTGAQLLLDIAMALHGLADRRTAQAPAQLSFHVSCDGGQVRVSAEACEQGRLLAAATVVGAHGRVRSRAWTERDRCWSPVPDAARHPHEPPPCATPAAERAGQTEKEDRRCSTLSPASYAHSSPPERRPRARWRRYLGFRASPAVRP